MNDRYEITGILHQDGDGILFNAQDKGSGAASHLYRFFPFGPDGGGLDEAESAAFATAVERLEAVHNTALRPVLGGGVDPVDGLPFLVIGQPEGSPLSEILASAPLDTDFATDLALHALDANQALSQIFNEDSLWIETKPESITYVPGIPKAHPTFRLSPHRWLASPEERRGVSPLLQLLETATGLHGGLVRGGFGAWLTLLRQHHRDWTPTQARASLDQMLAAAMAAPVALASPVATQQAPVLAPRMTTAAPGHPQPGAPAQTAPFQRPLLSQPRPPQTSSSSLWIIIATAVTAVSMIGSVVVWQGNKTKARRAAAVAKNSAAEGADASADETIIAEQKAPKRKLTPEEQASARAAELSKKIAEMHLEARQKPDLPEEQIIEQVIKVGEELRDHVGFPLGFEGIIHEIHNGPDGIYLEFSNSRDRDAACAIFRAKNPNSPTLEDLQGLLWNRVRVQGPSILDSEGRVGIDLQSFDGLQVLGE